MSDTNRVRAVLARRPGGREVLEVHRIAVHPPRADQVQVEVAAAGVNFIDVYQREGIYPIQTPFVLGMEGAGVVTAVGSDVSDVAVGDRVAWPQCAGSMAQVVNLAADQVVSVPDGVDLEVAAAAMLQGLTAHYLVNSTYAVQPGDIALVHAAAGGVGQLLVQLITAKGATVVATAGTAGKIATARRLGARHTVNYTHHDDPKALTEAIVEAAGRKLDVAYDGVGAATFEASVNSLAPRGMAVLFGASSGQVPPFDLQRLNGLGSLFVTRPSLGAYIATREELVWRATEILGALADDSLSLSIGGRWSFEEAASAYEALEGRHTSGKLLLVP